MRRKVPSLVGSITLFVGFFTVISNISTRFRGPARSIDQYFLVYLNSTGFATALFTGFIMILLARGLSRGKRRAWQISITILLVNLATEALRFHLHPTQIALTAFLILILVIFREEFKAKSDPSIRFNAFFLFIITFTFFLAVGVLLFYARHSANVQGNPTFLDLILTVLAGFVWLHGPVLLSSSLSEDTIYLTLGIFGVFILSLIHI